MTAESRSTLERAFEIRLDDSPFRVLLGEQVRLCSRRDSCPSNALGVLRGLLHHLAVIFALSHEVAAGHQIGAPEFSRHEKTLLGRVNDLPELKEWQQAPHHA